mmetsp:Transcript_6722/g.13442  ORF Transcript_6722/g.13442 Transcript_6722/m.13442 type:complete len:252 (-) Transcript_6722:190-945(-)
MQCGRFTKSLEFKFRVVIVSLDSVSGIRRSLLHSRLSFLRFVRFPNVAGRDSKRFDASSRILSPTKFPIPEGSFDILFLSSTRLVSLVSLSTQSTSTSLLLVKLKEIKLLQLVPSFGGRFSRSWPTSRSILKSLPVVLLKLNTLSDMSPSFCQLIFSSPVSFPCSTASDQRPSRLSLSASSALFTTLICSCLNSSFLCSIKNLRLSDSFFFFSRISCFSFARAIILESGGGCIGMSPLGTSHVVSPDFLAT